MALKSKRFTGDQKLEAAATADTAHIVRGASGAHVTRIQSALIELDGVPISGESSSLRNMDLLPRVPFLPSRRSGKL